MTEPRIALIVGATGLVGGHCLRLLLDHPAYARVVALVRRPLPARSDRLEQRVVDFDRLAQAEPPAVTDVFSALGTTIKKAGSQEAFRKVDYEYTTAAAELAVKGGARRLALVSSVGADPGASKDYLRVKGEVERALEALPLASLHLFRPSFLLGERGERRVGEAVGIAATRAVKFALVGGLRKYRAIEAETVAAAMIAAALQDLPGRHVLHFDEIVAMAERLRAGPSDR